MKNQGKTEWTIRLRFHVCELFSRTDEMPYRKGCFHDTDIYTFFLAFSRAENRITGAENKES